MGLVSSALGAGSAFALAHEAIVNGGHPRAAVLIVAAPLQLVAAIALYWAFSQLR